jgi:beta-lactam-binding protein with PASTA domain
VKTPKLTHLISTFVLGLLVLTPLQTAQAIPYTSPLHVFSIDDVQGGFNGSTFGTAGAVQDTSILCDAPGSSANCPAGVSPVTSPKMPPGSGTSPALYPVDSEFGFYVVDFLGAAQKIRDNDFLEGFVGNITANFPTSAMIDGKPVNYNPPIRGGVAVSNASTNFYKAKTPLGSWCRGLGGNSVKCETEHYSVLEHVLSCHEVIPYFFANPVSGAQAVLPKEPFPVDFGTTDCSLKGLDDVMIIRENDAPTVRLTDATVGVQMGVNDKTVLTDDIAVSSDYAVRLKADGKANYTWGGMVKLPNDIRIYARLALPEDWKQPGANYTVTAAKLVLRHTITNNPNDQLRPEDIENEAATGRKPSYEAVGNGVWLSTIDCFEGDGDVIGIEEGAGDPTPIEAGTVLKNTPFGFDDYNVENDLYAFSSDLVNGFTNAYYTSINRDPFEWSYDANPDAAIQDFVGSWLQNDALGTLVSGPRWRLRPNKFGQDLPGLEIPLIECSKPPFDKENIKYAVGEQTITEINLLDWNEAKGPSPLATTRGWVDVTQNGVVKIADVVNGIPVTTNGLPMTDDFDLAIYIKGDKKPVALYDAQLKLEWDEQTPVLVDVPAVAGLEEPAAVALIEANGLLADVAYAYSGVVAAGLVISQDPLACIACVAVDSTVSILVSLGPVPVPIDVPDVTGLPQADAEAAIIAADLTVGNITTAYSDTVPAGNVISQNPATCPDCAAPGDPVNLVISNGPAPALVDVPDVTGLSQAAAETAIANAGLTVGDVTMANSETVPAGDVISQDPAACTVCAAADDPVDLVVSTGPLDLSDISITSISVPLNVRRSGVVKQVGVTIKNAASAAGPGSGTVTLSGTDGSEFTADFVDLAPGSSLPFQFDWLSPESQLVIWTATVTVGGEIVDTVTARTNVQ